MPLEIMVALISFAGIIIGAVLTALVQSFLQKQKRDWEQEALKNERKRKQYTDFSDRYRELTALIAEGYTLFRGYTDLENDIANLKAKYFSSFPVCSNPDLMNLGGEYYQKILKMEKAILKREKETFIDLAQECIKLNLQIQLIVETLYDKTYSPHPSWFQRLIKFLFPEA